jgi:stage III sporulation protein AH
MDMKKIVGLILVMVMLTGCSGEVLETLTDAYAQPQPQVLRTLEMSLPEDAAVIAAGEDPMTVGEDYFAAVRLSRQQARDSALTLLQEAMAYSDQSKAQESSAELEEIVQTALTEAQIESLVIAKGYVDCVAYMSTEGVSIAVSAPEGGLQADDVAVIADIVMTQSEYTLDEIRIVEVQ